MKKYLEYMDERTVSDTLHQRLLGLETPKKRPAAWKKYGAAAAALVLVCGVGGFGAWAAHINRFDHPLPPYPAGVQGTQPELGDVGQPDIAPEEPGNVTEPGMKTNGGYEFTDGEMTSYFFLPYIEYAKNRDQYQSMMDWDAPWGCTKRTLTAEDLNALFGGEQTLSAHLGWEGYEFRCWAAWYEDGSLWGMFIDGYKGSMDHFEFAFTTGNVYPPTCIGYGEGKVNELWDVPVTAWSYDGKDGCHRRVEFLKDGCGFRFDITGSDAGQTEDIVSRVVRWVLVEGVAMDSVTADGAAPAHPYEADPGYSVGEPNQEDGGAQTRAYDPAVDGPIPDFVPDYDPSYEDSAPAEARSPDPGDTVDMVVTAEPYPGE